MKVDMSPKAVKGRLKLVAQLWRLSVSLGNAKKKTDERRKDKKNQVKPSTTQNASS